MSFSIHLDCPGHVHERNDTKRDENRLFFYKTLPKVDILEKEDLLIIICLEVGRWILKRQ